MFKKVASTSFLILMSSSPLLAQDLKFEPIRNLEVLPAADCKVYVQEFKQWPYTKTFDFGPLGQSGIMANVEVAARSDCQQLKGNVRAEAGVTVLGGINHALLSGKAEFISNRKTGQNHFEVDIDGVGKSIYAKKIEKNGSMYDSIDFPESAYTKNISGNYTINFEGISVDLKYTGTASLSGNLMYNINNKKLHGFLGIVNKGGVSVLSKAGFPGDDKWYEVKGDIILINHMIVGSMRFENLEGNKWEAYGGIIYHLNKAFEGSITGKGRWGNTTANKTFKWDGLEEAWEYPLKFDKQYDLL